jgi:hypothetical protein
MYLVTTIDDHIQFCESGDVVRFESFTAEESRPRWQYCTRSEYAATTTKTQEIISAPFLEKPSNDLTKSTEVEQPKQSKKIMKIPVSTLLTILVASLALLCTKAQPRDENHQEQMQLARAASDTFEQSRGLGQCLPDGTKCHVIYTCQNCCNEARQSGGTRCGGAKWTDGTICALGSTCKFCENPAGYWYEKAFTACGTEPLWKDGTACALGSTCKACENEATYWWSKAFTACGTEPKWEDGKVCALGTSCNACKNTATFWDSKFITACGDEPCWEERTVCASGTTCDNCCKGFSWKLDQFITSCD